MNVSCEKCGTTYRIDESRIPPQGIKAKCPKCNHSFVLHRPGGGAEEPSAGVPPDPFAGGGQSADPFGGGAQESFGGGAGGGAAASPGADPFAGSADPFGGTPPPPGMDSGFGGDDPFSGDTSAGGIDGLFGSNKTEFRVQRANGDVDGPFDLFTLKQMIYEQALDGTEKIEDAQGEFVDINTNEELAEIFRLLGRQGGAAAPPAAGPASGPPPGLDTGDPLPGPIDPGISDLGGDDAFDLDAVGGTSAKDRMLIGVEKAWDLSKQRGTLIVVGVIVLVLVLAGVGYTQRDAISRLLGFEQAAAAKISMTKGESKVFAGVRGVLQGAANDFGAAHELRPEDPYIAARLAEANAALWRREPARQDAKQQAETLLASAEKEFGGGDAELKAAVLRARARVALARGDGAAAQQAVTELAAVKADDIAVPFLTGEVALFNGDASAALEAFKIASGVSLPPETEGGIPRPIGWSFYGAARAKALQNDWPGAAQGADAALQAEKNHGGARVIKAFALVRGKDPEQGRRELLAAADDASLFAVERARAQYYLGVLAEDASKPDAALYWYKRTINADPFDAEARAAAKRLFSQRFPKRNTEAWLKAISTVRGSIAMDQVAAADDSLRLGKAVVALTSAEKAAQKDPASARVLLTLGQVLIEVNETEWAKARTHLERAAQIDPDYPEVQVALAQVLILQKEFAAAGKAAARAVEIDPISVEGRIAAGQTSLQAGNPKRAEKHFIVASQFNPDSAPAFSGLGSSLVAQERTSDAIEFLQKAVDLSPEQAEPLMDLGRAYEALGQVSDAADAYAKATTYDPENIALQIRVGVLHVKAGNFKDGKKVLEKMEQVRPENSELHFYLAQANEFGSPADLAEAETHYKQVNKLNPKNHLAYYHLGIISFSQGLMGDAQDYFETALQANPEFYEANEKLADLYVDFEEFDKALAELKKVERAASEAPREERREALSRVYLAQGRIWRTRSEKSNPQKAKGLLRRVLKLDPKNADALYEMGLLERDAGRDKVALDYFRRAVKADDQFAAPWQDLGFLYKQADACKASLRAFRNYLKIDPAARDRESVESEISYLEADCG